MRNLCAVLGANHTDEAIRAAAEVSITDFCHLLWGQQQIASRI
jgi:hypothetical protein